MIYPASIGGNPVRQEFQFPPIIKTNVMSGTFTEDASNGDTNAPGQYPGYMYRGPQQREFTVETTYIIDGASWDNDKVISEVRKYRSYYFDLTQLFDSPAENGGGEDGQAAVNAKVNPPQGKAAIMMRMWGFSGLKEMPVYMSNLSISHSGPLILPETRTLRNNASIAPTGYRRQSNVPDVRNTQYAYSMKTDVSFSLTLWVPYSATAKTIEEDESPIIERTWH